MSIQELMAMRDRFDGVRRRTSVADHEMGEALTDAVDSIDELMNVRRIGELALIDAAAADASHDEFTAYWQDQFAMAGSC